MKKRKLSLLTGTLGLVLVGANIVPAQAAIKCWTNNEGVRECGDRVPPEFAQKGHQELSKSGMVLDEQERAKTEEELAKEAIEKERLAEQKRMQEERARADRVLLATFSSVEEIELVRDERIRAIEASITLAKKQTESIQQDLDKRIQAAANAERSGKEPNDALLKDIESLERQIAAKHEYVDDRQAELDQTKHDYAANIDRFKELKGI